MRIQKAGRMLLISPLNFNEFKWKQIIKPNPTNRVCLSYLLPFRRNGSIGWNKTLPADFPGTLIGNKRANTFYESLKKATKYAVA